MQELESLKNMQPCLLLFTDKNSVNMMSDNGIKNIDTLDLLNYYQEGLIARKMFFLEISCLLSVQ
mgnify:CR=1 FL=1